MDKYESLSHTVWSCKYHVAFIPKSRRKTFYVALRRHLGEVFRKLALWKESKVEEGRLMLDHVHTLLSVPPKFRRPALLGLADISSTRLVGMRTPYGPYIRNQEKEDRRLEQLNLWR